MEISPIRMALLLFYSFLLGVGVGAFYDVNRIIRVIAGIRYSTREGGWMTELRLPFLKIRIGEKSKCTGSFLQKAIVFFGDFASVVCAGAGIILLNYSYNSGKFRFFTVLGLLAGFFIYYFSLGKLVMLVSEPIAILAKYVFLSFFIVLCYPVYIVLKFLVQKVAKFGFLCTFAIEKKRKKVYNINSEVYLLEMSKNGFMKLDGVKEDGRQNKVGGRTYGKKKVRRSS